MPAAVARRKLPDAIYLQPDFPAYREASAQVMEVLRRNVETVEVVGLDEAYLDLTGIFSPKATMRRVAAEIRRSTGLTCSVGISESRMLAKITSELGKPAGLVVLSREDALERFAGRVARAGPRDRAEDGDQAAGDGDPHARRPARPRARGARSRLRPALGRLAARPRPALGRDPDHRLPRDQIAVGGDDLRRRRAPTGPSSSRSSPSRPRSSAGGSRKRELRGPHDRDQGPARRLDQRHPLAHGRGADQRPGRGRAGGPGAAARLRPAAPGAPARRPRRLFRAARRPAEAEPAEPDSSGSASPPDVRGLSGSPAPSPRRGSRAAPWSPR